MTGLEGLAALGVAAGATAQAVTGFGFALVAAPALVAALGPTQGVSVVCILGVLASLLPYAREARHTDWRAVALWWAPTLAVTLLLGAALAGLDARLLSALSGAAVILAVVLLARGRTSVRLAGRRGAVLAGAVSGAMNLVGGVGGPPVALYASNAGWPIERVRPTLMAFFAVQNVVTVAVIGWVWPGPALVVALVIGSVLGVAVASRLDAAAVRIAVLAVAAAGGAALIAGAVL